MDQIGRYQILGELGRGAMGIVYKAQDSAIGRTIAIKSIRLTDLSDEKERERLRERLFREIFIAGVTWVTIRGTDVQRHQHLAHVEAPVAATSQLAPEPE